MTLSVAIGHDLSSTQVALCLCRTSWILLKPRSLACVRAVRVLRRLGLCLSARRSLAPATFLQLLHDLIQIETRRLLPLGVIPERHKETAHKVLRGHEQEGVIDQPVVVSVRRDVRPFVRIEAEVIDLRHAETGKRVGPDQQRAEDL